MKLTAGQYQDLNVGAVLPGTLRLIYYAFGLPH